MFQGSLDCRLDTIVYLFNSSKSFATTFCSIQKMQIEEYENCTPRMPSWYFKKSDISKVFHKGDIFTCSGDITASERRGLGERMGILSLASSSVFYRNVEFR